MHLEKQRSKFNICYATVDKKKIPRKKTGEVLHLQKRHSGVEARSENEVLPLYQMQLPYMHA